ncbi:hypothetical protein [Leclercia tamurae]|uniref:Lipoprotein n=1 Tax=Leclercia tamurae TaxID=2926467 RepID=A0ABT2R9Z8_9ENTR|nr:hypothetical protein [Leclercia tamurae]MCU6677670.1 hypothetical protein [Leclercia tamurae]
MNKNISVLLAATLISGCSVDFTDTLPDYTGSDVSYIRVENTPHPTPFRIEKQIPAGQCWKSEHAYGITSKVAIIGVKIRTSKYVAGIAPPSTKFANKSFQEYSVQSGYTYSIWWKREVRTMYGMDLGQTYSDSFFASKGHTYEIGSDNNNIVITDLSSEPVEKTKSLPECRFKTSLLGKKQYL